MFKILICLSVVTIFAQSVMSHSHHHQNNNNRHHDRKKQQAINDNHNDNIDYCKLKCPLFDPVSGAVLLPGPTRMHFYECRFGVGILFTCSPGTLFNPKKQVCDWPWQANAVACSGSPNNENEGSGEYGSGDGGDIRIF